MAQTTDALFSIQYYGEPRSYVKQLTNPKSMKTRNPGDNNDVYAFMQAYYQSERALPPVDKSMASPVQAMMMMSSPVVTKRVGAVRTTLVANLLNACKSHDGIN